MVELATATVLLVGAGLLGKSLYHLLAVNVGFEPDHLVTLKITASGPNYRTDQQAAAFVKTTLERFQSVPGVMSVADGERLIRHFMKVNSCTKAAFKRHADRASAIWRARSKKKWRVDWGPFKLAVEDAEAARIRRRLSIAAAKAVREGI